MPATLTHVFASATFGLATLAANAAGTSCQPVVDATLKLATTASHQTTSYERGGKSQIVMEAVVIDQVKWLRIGPGGAWRKETSNSGKGLAELQKADCRYVRDDNADGEPATVYEVSHLGGEAGSRTEEAWISKASGLLLRIAVVDGRSRSGAMTRFDYRGVKAPAP